MGLTLLLGANVTFPMWNQRVIAMAWKGQECGVACGEGWVWMFCGFRDARNRLVHYYD